MTELTERGLPLARERLEIGVLRHVLRRWPLDRGKGWIWKLSRPMWRATQLVEIEPNVLVRARYDDYVFRWAFVNAFYQEPAIALSRTLINNGDTVIDAGANIGLWAMGAARRAGEEGAVHAFEPVPESFDELRANIELNALDQVHAVRRGLSHRRDHATIYLPTNGNSGMASLARDEGVERSLEIDLTTLDEYCGENDIARIDFLKMDVEGAELAVVEGGRNILKTGPIVLFEACEKTARRFGRSAADVKGRLAEMGYRIFRLNRKRLEHVSVDARHEANEDLFAFTDAHLESVDPVRALVATNP